MFANCVQQLSRIIESLYFFKTRNHFFSSVPDFYFCFYSLFMLLSFIFAFIYHQIQCRGKVWSQPTVSGTVIPVSGLWPSVRLPHQPARSRQTGEQLAPSTASPSPRVTATVPVSHRTQVGTWLRRHWTVVEAVPKDVSVCCKYTHRRCSSIPVHR